MAIALSALDLVPVSEGSNSGQAVADSLTLARELDRLGFQRVWYAEHHNMPAIASTTPATLIALAAQQTQRIRVGSGGVMLPNHAPLQVAETFKLLESIYPGRIDLGIGRAPGTDQVTALALRRSREALLANDFPDQLAELMDFGAGLQRNHPFVGVTAYPEDTPLPPIVLLGSSDFSSALAAKLGLAFGFAAHFSPDRPDLPMLSYRREFQASEYLEAPHAILTLSVICADQRRGRAARQQHAAVVGAPALRPAQQDPLARDSAELPVQRARNRRRPGLPTAADHRHAGDGA